MKILFTGFEPFGGETVNPSFEAVRRLPERLLWVVSVLAAFGHNAGQLLVAVWVTGTPSILVYAPALVAASVITGAFTGVAAMYLVRALRKTGHFPQA